MTVTESVVGHNRGEQIIETELFLNHDERLVRDFELAQRVQAGYTPAEPTDDIPEPRIIDGNLDADGQAALSELWTAYERVAIKLARKQSLINQEAATVDFDDFLQEAFFGLYHSAVKWDPAEQEIAFITHAYQSMENYMIGYRDDEITTMRLPRNVRAAVRKMNRVIWDEYADKEKMPSLEEIADKMDLTVRQVQKLLKAKNMTDHMVSLDSSFLQAKHDEPTSPADKAGRDQVWESIDSKAAKPLSVEEHVLADDLQIRMVNLLRGMNFPQSTLTILGHRHLGDLPRTPYSDLVEITGVAQTKTVKAREANALGSMRISPLSDDIRNYYFEFED